MKYYCRGIYLSYQETWLCISKLPETSCKDSHARRTWAFTVKGVATSHTPLSLNGWILLALYFYLIFHLLLLSPGMLWYALLVFGERIAMGSQWGLYLVTNPAFLLQFPGCKGFWLIARQAVFAFQGPWAQLTYICRSKRSLLKRAAAPPCYRTSFCGFSLSRTRS